MPLETSWATDFFAAEPAAPVLVAAFGMVVLMQLFGRRDKEVSPRRATDEPVRRPTNVSLFRRLIWSIHPPHDLMKVDGLTIDRTRKPHAAWLGPTGAGKSASVATVRCNGKRVYLAAMPDLSDPLIDATARLGGFRWTAGVSTTPIDFLIGSPQAVAGRLTEIFRSGGVGSWKRKAYLATTEVIQTIDNHGEPRTLRRIADYLQAAVKTDRELKLVCDGWVSRFMSVAEKFGPSAGPNGVDLADLINRNIPVLIDNDAWTHSDLCEDVVAFALAEAKRIGDLCPNGFRLIFEEAGQMGERIELAYPFFRAGRRRRVMVDVLTQAESDLKIHGNDAIIANLATRVYFAQEEEHLQKIAANRLGIPHRDLDPANMSDFTAYVAHGKIRRLVKFPKPPKFSYETHPTSIPTEPPYARRMVIEQIGAPAAPEYPALPLPPLEVREVLGKIDRSQGDCWLWTGSIDKDGYGVQRWEYPDGRPKNNRPAHQVVWEIANGRWFPVGEWDHRRSCPRHCVNPYHGEPVTKRTNVQRMHRTRGHVTAK